MSNMRAYYISRFVVVLVLVAAFLLLGARWWQAGLIGFVALVYFLWAPLSGRYTVDPKEGATALQRDERTKGIRDRAARNAWVLMTLVGAGTAVYYGYLGQELIPLQVLSGLLALGMIAYFASDVWLRRA